MTDPTRPATGYPAQPTNGYPPAQQPNPYYYPNHNPNPYPHAPPPYQPSPQRATFFRRVISALIFLFIIMATVLFIVWLILRPRVPTFTLTTLSLSALSLSPSSSQLSAAWALRFTVTNPNSKLHVFYDEVEARLFYSNSLLAQNELHPFDQGVRNVTTMDARLAAVGAYVDPGLGRRVGEEKGKGSVKFNVQVLAIVRFKAGGWRARRRFLRVFCDDLAVSVGSGGNGTLSGGPRRCAVGI